METLHHTPLHAAHNKLGARMVPFAGWDMPVMYSSILDEARAVRNKCGIFDISHMGRLYIEGEDALALLQRTTTNDVGTLGLGKAHYSLIPNPEGGIIDDIIVYRVGPSRFLVVINASNSDKDIDWLKTHASSGVQFNVVTNDTVMIAVQGPDAVDLVARTLKSPEVKEIDRFCFAPLEFAAEGSKFAITACRTGYTGEDGFELIAPADAGERLWGSLMEQGAVPCGLGARDTLRIEAGYPLYGHEIDDFTSPVEALLMWAVSLTKGEFIGRESIVSLKAGKPTRKLMGLKSVQRMQPRQGYTLFSNGEKIGTITSGTFSPVNNLTLAMAYVDSWAAVPGTVVQIQVRDKYVDAEIIPKKAMLQFAR